MVSGDRLSIIHEDGKFTLTARVGSEVHTYKVETLAWLDAMEGLAEHRLMRVTVKPGAQGIEVR